MIRKRPPAYSADPVASVSGDVAVSAYENRHGHLSIDTDQSLRSVVVDGLKTPIRGRSDSFSLPLENNVSAFGPAEVPAQVFVGTGNSVSADGSDDVIDTNMKLVTSDGIVHAVGSFQAPPGTFPLYVSRSGKLVKSSKAITIKPTGHFVIHTADDSEFYVNQLFI